MITHDTGKDEIAREKAKLQQAVAELNGAASSLSKQGDSLDKQSKVLDTKERSVREGAAQLRIAQTGLRQREQELVDGMKELEARMMELGSRDRDLTGKRLELAAKQRELSGQVVGAALAGNGITINAPSVGSSAKGGKPVKMAWNQTETSQNGHNEQTENVSPSNRATSSGPTSDWMRTFTERLAVGANQNGNRGDSKNHAISTQLADTKRTLQVSERRAHTHIPTYM